MLLGLNFESYSCLDSSIRSPWKLLSWFTYLNCLNASSKRSNSLWLSRLIMFGVSKVSDSDCSSFFLMLKHLFFLIKKRSCILKRVFNITLVYFCNSTKFAKSSSFISLSFARDWLLFCQEVRQREFLTLKGLRAFRSETCSFRFWGADLGVLSCLKIRVISAYVIWLPEKS